MLLALLLDDNLHIALKELSSQKLPIEVAFAIKGIKKKIEEELDKYEEVRKDILARHGEKNEDGSLKIDQDKNVVFAEGKMEEFLQELNELVNHEVDVGKIPIKSLAGATITADQLMYLGDLID